MDFDYFVSVCYQYYIMKKSILGDGSFVGEKFIILKTGALVLVILILGACGASMLPTKDIWYGEHYIIMQDFEREAYKKLSPEAREKFQTLFWEARSPESKMVFMKRLDYVMKAFRKENSHQPWNTDRARIFLLNGNPASVEYRQTDNWAMRVQEGGTGATGITQERDKEDIQARTAEVWSYPYKGQLIYYVYAFSAPNKWKLAQGTFSGNRFLGALEIRNREQTYGIIDIEQYTKELENLKKIK